MQNKRYGTKCKKCHTKVFFRAKDPVIHSYSINNVILDCSPNIKDLEVILGTSVHFIFHMNKSISKAIQMLGFIEPCTSLFNNITSVRIMFYALVRMPLDYRSSVWPRIVTLMLEISLVQSDQWVHVRSSWL